MGVRRAAWREVTGRELAFQRLDVARDYEALLALLESWRPDAVVHFAEQRAAPYSMKSARHKRYTVSNNVNATHNLLAALVETDLDAHVVHLGTMGVYGYGTAGVPIPEGYLSVRVDTDDGGEVEQEILFPTSPGSVYHMTKTQDQLLFAFYNRNDEVRVTDLHQGIVWGTQTAETKLDERLINRFDYDGDYGTVLNRFLMQAAIGYPLTVHGTGGQTRAFIHIQDTVRCIELAVEHPPAPRRARADLQPDDRDPPRDRPRRARRRGSPGATIDLVDNPRKEAAENDLPVANDHLLSSSGWIRSPCEDDLLNEVTEIASATRPLRPTKIPCRSLWVRNRPPQDAAPAERSDDAPPVAAVEDVPG